MTYTQDEYFKILTDSLNNGFKIIDSKFPYLKLTNDIDEIELDLNLEKPIIKEIVKPDYNNSLVNIINSIRSNYNKDTNYEIDKCLFDKYYKNTIILILDGLGKNILDEFSKRYPSNFLAKYLYKYLVAIYPSTTACATTSIKSGLLPYETSWTGWANYFSEVDKDLVLFNGRDYYTDEQYEICAYDIIPQKTYFDDLDVKGAAIEPDFSKKSHELADVLNQCLDKINKGYNTFYLYDTEPDGLLHKFGTKDKDIYKTLNKYSKQIEKFYQKLPSNTLLMISADHGHIDNINIKFYLDRYLYSLLERRPTNDQRCLTFKIKDGKKEEFKTYFNAVYGSIYNLYSKEDFINEGFVGFSKTKGKKLDDFLADFVCIAKSNYTLSLKEKALTMKSNHAGITSEEMIIPLIVLKK